MKYWTPTKPIIINQTTKRKTMITTKWNHRNNIGITPHRDYINHGTTIPYINNAITTHERVKTSSMNEMNECNEFMNK